MQNTTHKYDKSIDGFLLPPKMVEFLRGHAPNENYHALRYSLNISRDKSTFTFHSQPVASLGREQLREYSDEIKYLPFLLSYLKDVKHCEIDRQLLDCNISLFELENKYIEPKLFVGRDALALAKPAPAITPTNHALAGDKTTEPPYQFLSYHSPDYETSRAALVNTLQLAPEERFYTNYVAALPKEKKPTSALHPYLHARKLFAQNPLHPSRFLALMRQSRSSANEGERLTATEAETIATAVCGFPPLESMTLGQLLRVARMACGMPLEDIRKKVPEIYTRYENDRITQPKYDTIDLLMTLYQPSDELKKQAFLRQKQALGFNEMPPSEITMAQFVKNYRLDKHWSQDQLANKSDISATTIAAIEHGDRCFTIPTLRALLEKTNASPEQQEEAFQAWKNHNGYTHAPLERLRLGPLLRNIRLDALLTPPELAQLMHSPPGTILEHERGKFPHDSKVLYERLDHCHASKESYQRATYLWKKRKEYPLTPLEEMTYPEVCRTIALDSEKATTQLNRSLNRPPRLMEATVLKPEEDPSLLLEFALYHEAGLDRILQLRQLWVKHHLACANHSDSPHDNKELGQSLADKFDQAWANAKEKLEQLDLSSVVPVGKHTQHIINCKNGGVGHRE